MGMITRQYFMITLLFLLILSTYRQMDAPMAESAIAQIPEENPETAIEELWGIKH